MKKTITFQNVELDCEFEVIPAEKETNISQHIGWMKIKIGSQDVTELLDQHIEEIETLMARGVPFQVVPIPWR
jgi:hypothetical protein